jgi:hypothetical protein
VTQLVGFLTLLAELKTLLKIELEGCDIADDEDYRKSAFATISTLSNVDGFDKRGIEIPGKFIQLKFCRKNWSKIRCKAKMAKRSKNKISEIVTFWRYASLRALSFAKLSHFKKTTHWSLDPQGLSFIQNNYIYNLLIDNLDDDDEDEEEEEESEEEESGGGGLAALYNADLPSEDEEDGDYDSNEEPEGSDGEEEEDEIIQPSEGNDEGAGSSG